MAVLGRSSHAVSMRCCRSSPVCPRMCMFFQYGNQKYDKLQYDRRSVFTHVDVVRHPMVARVLFPPIVESQINSTV